MQYKFSYEKKKWCENNWISICEIKLNLALNLHLRQKLIQNRPIALDVKAKTIQIPEENIGENSVAVG